MRPTTTAASVGIGCLLLAWLASAVGISRVPPRPRPSEAPSESRQLEALRADVQAQSARLRERLSSAPAPRPAERNPFAFANRDAGRPRLQPVAPAPGAYAEPTAPEPAETVLVLIGIAERTTPDGMVRTAILAGAADHLHLVIEGEEVAGVYRVRAIGADSVELAHAASGAVRRLHLK
jgi:hypothetical protein